jgi:hypothetical protein
MKIKRTMAITTTLGHIINIEHNNYISIGIANADGQVIAISLEVEEAQAVADFINQETFIRQEA